MPLIVQGKFVLSTALFTMLPHTFLSWLSLVFRAVFNPTVLCSKSFPTVLSRPCGLFLSLGTYSLAISFGPPPLVEEDHAPADTRIWDICGVFINWSS